MPDEPIPPRDTRALGRGMLYAMWLLVLGGLYFGFQQWVDSQHNPNRELARVSIANGPVVLQRNRAGHYVASGALNGQPVTFLLDTGASDISIPARLADRIGLRRGAALVYETAAGRVTNYLTRVDRVSLGAIHVDNVRASINPHTDADEVLLGMTFLKHLDFTQQGDELILQQPGHRQKIGN
jgi:aspartyl protease family protein